MKDALLRHQDPFTCCYRWKKMSRSSSLLPLLLLAFVFVWQAEIIAANTSAVYQPSGGEGSLRPEECAGKCEYRCSETSHKKPCLFFCKMCCAKCLCVPSGTYGHKEECPCYNNWKTKEGKPKCP